MSFGEDGGIGRNPLLPRTTKRRITTDLKSISNQKYQKTKLRGTATSKELKKKSVRTTKLVMRLGQLRKTQARCWTRQVGLADGETETQSLL